MDEEEGLDRGRPSGGAPEVEPGAGETGAWAGAGCDDQGSACACACAPPAVAIPRSAAALAAVGGGDRATPGPGAAAPCAPPWPLAPVAAAAAAASQAAAAPASGVAGRSEPCPGVGDSVARRNGRGRSLLYLYFERVFVLWWGGESAGEGSRHAWMGRGEVFPGG